MQNNTICAKSASQVNAERPFPVLSMPNTWQDFTSGLHDSSFSVRVCMPRVFDSAVAEYNTGLAAAAAL